MTAPQRRRPYVEAPPAKKTRFSTVPEVAKVLNLCKMSVYRLIHNGDLPAYKFGGSYRIPTQAVWAYISKSRVDFDSIQETKAL